MRTCVRFIGDVHGKLDWNILGRPTYLDRIAECEASVQLGDMGDAAAYEMLEERVDPRLHRFVPGNHDDYDRLPPHALGDFGVAEAGGVRLFFVRGAFSVDKALRLRSKIPWWPQEEMDSKTMDEALDAYRTERPEIVASHECPTVAARELGDAKALEDYGFDPATFESRTGKLLQAMFECHAPRLWVFGHFHRSWRRDIGGTLFVCLEELGCVDVDSAGGIVR